MANSAADTVDVVRNKKHSWVSLDNCEGERLDDLSSDQSLSEGVESSEFMAKEVTRVSKRGSTVKTGSEQSETTKDGDQSPRALQLLADWFKMAQTKVVDSLDSQSEAFTSEENGGSAPFSGHSVSSALGKEAEPYLNDQSQFSISERKANDQSYHSAFPKEVEPICNDHSQFALSAMEANDQTAVSYARGAEPETTEQAAAMKEIVRELNEQLMDGKDILELEEQYSPNVLREYKEDCSQSQSMDSSFITAPSDTPVAEDPSLPEQVTPRTVDPIIPGSCSLAPYVCGSYSSTRVSLSHTSCTQESDGFCTVEAASEDYRTFSEESIGEKEPSSAPIAHGSTSLESREDCSIVYTSASGESLDPITQGSVFPSSKEELYCVSSAGGDSGESCVRGSVSHESGDLVASGSISRESADDPVEGGPPTINVMESVLKQERLPSIGRDEMISLQDSTDESSHERFSPVHIDMDITPPEDDHLETSGLETKDSPSVVNRCSHVSEDETYRMSPSIARAISRPEEEEIVARVPILADSFSRPENEKKADNTFLRDETDIYSYSGNDWLAAKISAPVEGKRASTEEKRASAEGNRATTVEERDSVEIETEEKEVRREEMRSLGYPKPIVQDSGSEFRKKFEDSRRLFGASEAKRVEPVGRRVVYKPPPILYDHADHSSEDNWDENSNEIGKIIAASMSPSGQVPPWAMRFAHSMTPIYTAQTPYSSSLIGTKPCPRSPRSPRAPIKSKATPPPPVLRRGQRKSATTSTRSSESESAEKIDSFGIKDAETGGETDGGRSTTESIPGDRMTDLVVTDSQQLDQSDATSIGFADPSISRSNYAENLGAETPHTGPEIDISGPTLDGVVTETNRTGHDDSLNSTIRGANSPETAPETPQTSTESPQSGPESPKFVAESPETGPECDPSEIRRTVSEKTEQLEANIFEKHGETTDPLENGPETSDEDLIKNVRFSSGGSPQNRFSSGDDAPEPVSPRRGLISLSPTVNPKHLQGSTEVTVRYSQSLLHNEVVERSERQSSGRQEAKEIQEGVRGRVGDLVKRFENM